MIMQMAKSKQMIAIGGLIGAFMIHLVVGAIYRWNMIAGYVGMYYNSSSSETPIGGPLLMLCAGATMRLGSKCSDMFGSKCIITIGLALAIFATIISSLMPSFYRMWLCI